MVKIFLAIFLSFLSCHLSAQEELDSLFAVWQNENLSDTLRIYALSEYINEGYYYSKPDSAIILGNQLIKFARENNYEINVANALITQGYTYFRTGRYPEALKAYKEALEVTERLNDNLRTGDVLMQTGFLYHDNEEFIKAINFYEKALVIFQNAQDTSGLSSIYNELGLLHRQRKDFDKSLNYFLKSLSLTENWTGTDGSPAQHNNIGLLYLDMKYYDKSLVNLEKALKIYSEWGDRLGIAASLNGIGNVYGKQGQTDKALEFLKRSLKIERSINNTLGVSTTLLNIGEYLNETKKYVQAIFHCQESLELAQSLGDLGNQESACDCLYKAYRATGNIDRALYYHEQSQSLSDSINAEQTSIKLQQMEFSKQVLADSLLQVEKDLGVEMAHQTEVRKKDKNRNFAIAVGIVFLLISISFFSRWRYVKKSNAIIEKEKNRSESLLLNILPAEIAEELKEKGEAAARDFEMVSILFTDFEGFTEKSAELSASELIGEINHCFKAFDHICEKYGVEKIKTIGDAYMAAGGLSVSSENSVRNTILAALEMQSFMTQRVREKNSLNDFFFEMRLDIHTGPVVAGIVGVKKFQYDIWGDAVNTASRIESNGEIGKVNISQNTFELLKNDPLFCFEHRGKLLAKGKGEIDMWFVEKV